VEPLAIALGLVLVALGLGFAGLGARSGPSERLRAAGFTPSGDRHVASRDGFELSVEGDRVTVALAMRPIPYERMVRALGLGNLLAELFHFEAKAGPDRLEGRLPTGRARDLELALQRLTRLCRALEALPIAEALSRHYLELGDGEDPVTELERLLSHCPDAPETLAVCRQEVESRRHPTLAARAREHLAKRAASLGEQA
jgi:hypothetical protein